jgi:predicted RNA-binding protein YlxR (DUF448 family)
MANPVRTCVACRRSGEKGELIKLANTPSGVVIDYAERLTGRGAYICADEPCIEKGLNEKALSRAFKRKAAPPGKDAFYEELKTKVEKKALSLIGMAMKSGNIARGFEAAADASRKYPDGLLILAGDISGNTEEKLMRSKPSDKTRVVRYKTKDALGEVVGVTSAAVVYISDRGLASALYREIGRLNSINRG